MIEMMVVIFLIGVMATITIPRLAYKSPKAEWGSVLDELNNITLFARQEAIANHTVYRLNFKPNGSNPDTVTIEQEIEDPEKPGKKNYKQATSYYIKTQYQLHPSIKIKAFYHGHRNELSSSDGNTYCYIIPNGLVQDVLIHLIKSEKGVGYNKSIKMMPFYGKFEMEEGFVKPEG
jgi:Tfp pilus assembly protein FimT